MWMSHATHVNESCHTSIWVLHGWLGVLGACLICQMALHFAFFESHKNESRHTWMNDSCHSCEWVTSHMRMSHVTHVNESRHTFIWVGMYMGLQSASRSLLPMNENKSCHICEWVTSHIYLDRWMGEWNESRHTCEWVTSHIYLGVWIRMSDVTRVGE